MFCLCRIFSNSVSLVLDQCYLVDTSFQKIEMQSICSFLIFEGYYLRILQQCLILLTGMSTRTMSHSVVHHVKESAELELTGQLLFLVGSN